MSAVDFIPPALPDGLASILEVYGDPKPRQVNGEWVVDEAWERANMTTVHHDYLPHGKLYVHRRIVGPLLFLLDDWRAIGYPLHSVACFAPRAQRGTRGLLMSLHTLGVAVDFNPEENHLVAPCEPDDPRRDGTDIPPECVLAAQRRGFFWGGAFKHRFDPMHFQAATGY